MRFRAFPGLPPVPIGTPERHHHVDDTHHHGGRTPTFDDGVDDDGDTPDETEPSTDAIVGDGEARPSDRSWMLVIALGMLLASVVIITPSTAVRQHRN